MEKAKKDLTEKNPEFLLNSQMLDKNLYDDIRAKFFFQIEPAIKYCIDYIIEAYLSSNNKYVEIKYYGTQQKIDFIRKEEAISGDVIDQIDLLHFIVITMRKLPVIKRTRNKIEVTASINRVSEANKYIDDTRNAIIDLIKEN